MTNTMTKQEMWTRHHQIVDRIVELTSNMSSADESGYLSKRTGDRMKAELDQLKLELDQLFTIALNYKEESCCFLWAAHD